MYIQCALKEIIVHVIMAVILYIIMVLQSLLIHHMWIKNGLVKTKTKK